jgi:rhamnopyranosyl-N-acetylglucosaminyl-diphospho-decaprenol beta-1,3/1,4-galactofuranosyltransferase
LHGVAAPRPLTNIARLVEADATRAERVCAVVVTYNRLELLRECLTALESQTRPVDRVLVIDNASSDGTPEAVEREHPSAELVRLGENLGGAGGFHEGARRAYEGGFDWIWLMDDDTIPTETALEELLKAPAGLDGLPRPLVLASKVLGTDGNLHPFNVSRTDERDPDLVVAAVERGFTPIRYTSFVSAFVHRDAFTEVGMPLAEYFIWFDDVEFTARAIKDHAGFLAPRSVVLHKSGTVGNVYGGERYYYAVRNLLWLLRSGSLRGDTAIRLRFWRGLARGIPTYLRIERFRPRALWAVLRGLRDGLRRLPG